ncbi:MAG: hypothetical protein DI539_19720 [Flavobacterium psychrophilum]|nr:MAG: hypothetical protein DI539_19720 [Flavobacterium psychrophilum]
MRLSEFKKQLESLNSLSFLLPEGTFVPNHFHITEAGITTKNFIDCGGTVRSTKNITFQLWTADDYQHRLEPQKLLKIIDIAEPLFQGEDHNVVIEYQSATVGVYGLDSDGVNFLLTPTQTDCLAQDACGIPVKTKLKLSELNTNATTSCSPGGGCC